MDSAFFVSRTELLHWVNSTLQLQVTKIEQCANGAVYCQIIDACHPGTVALRRVNWNAGEDHQCIPNYKVLQQAFDKNHIQRHIEVDKLIRGKYQDNLEMLQWIKSYYDRLCPGGDYDAAGLRPTANLPEWARPQNQGKSRPVFAPAQRAAASFAGPPAAPKVSRAASSNFGRSSSVTSVEFDGLKVSLEEHERLREEVVDLKITVDGLETERDFYFQKLRDIEILCQALEANPEANVTVTQFVEDLQRILYAKDEDDDLKEPENVR